MKYKIDKKSRIAVAAISLLIAISLSIIFIQGINESDVGFGISNGSNETLEQITLLPSNETEETPENIDETNATSEENETQQTLPEINESQAIEGENNSISLNDSISFPIEPAPEDKPEEETQEEEPQIAPINDSTVVINKTKTENKTINKTINKTKQPINQSKVFSTLEVDGKQIGLRIRNANENEVTSQIEFKKKDVIGLA